jgi:hypothetical protein
VHNPYASPHAGADASGRVHEFTADGGTRGRDYEDAIGPNAHYYRRRFEEYDAGGARVSWHWPAFLATSCWYVYRKMYLVGVLNFFFPWLAYYAIEILVRAGLLPRLAGTFAIPVLLTLLWIVLTLFANRIYWRRIRGLIDEIPALDAPERRSRDLARMGGVARVAMVATAVATVLYATSIVLALAAFVRPAYQMYTIRAQVLEGLNLASQKKREVANYWAAHGDWPHQADVSPTTSGEYVRSINVASGSVIITYGNRANSVLEGKRLILFPGVTESGEVVWACGYAQHPKGVRPGEGPQTGYLPAQYLPATCLK